jgi:hypothetical protein
MNSCCISAVGPRLLKGRAHHGSARASQRIGKCLVCRRVGRRAEIDVEYDVGNISAFQPPQQVGMEAAWPWPDSDFLDRGSIDRNNDNVAGGLTRHPGEPRIGQCIAEHAVPAGRQHDGQRNHHKDMRPIVFQVVPIFTSRSRPRAPSGGLNIIRPICNGRKRGHGHSHSHSHYHCCCFRCRSRRCCCHCHCHYHFRCSPRLQ